MNNRFQAVSVAISVIIMFSFCLQAEPISSRPVGVTTINIPAKSQVAASLPYVPFIPTMDSLIGGQLTNDVGILLWNHITQRYEPVNRVDGKWQQASTTGEVSIIAGDAFWVVNRQYTNQILLLGGEVNLAMTNSAMLFPGMNLIGLPQNTGIRVEKSGLAGLGKDSLVDAQGNAVSNMVPGEGYWYSRNEAECRAWVEVLPYSAEMFPAEGLLPSITGIRVVAPIPGAGTPSVTLAISLDKGCKKVDIYYKDQVAADSLALDKDWLIAEADLAVGGKNTLEWADVANSQRKPVSEVFARYYLVGRVDVDLDKDGIPDCREKFVTGKAWPLSSQSMEDNGSLSDFAGTMSPSSNSVSRVLKSSLLVGRVIYVDMNNGADHLTGRASVVVGSDGPKKTVNAGLQEAGNDGSTLIIKSGTYGENLNISGKNVNVVIQGNVKL